MKTKVFNGELFEQKVTRKITTVDPATNRPISKLAKYDMVTGLVLDRVSGLGKSEKTGEDQITLSGQYKPFQTLRITASAQNYDKVVSALKGNVNEDETRSLKNEITVTAVGNLMKGHGMNLAELYIHDGDKITTVIAAPEQPTEGQSVSDTIF